MKTLKRSVDFGLKKLKRIYLVNLLVPRRRLPKSLTCLVHMWNELYKCMLPAPCHAHTIAPRTPVATRTTTTRIR